MFCKGNWNFTVTQGINVFQQNLQPSTAKQNKHPYEERARAAGPATRAGLLSQRLPQQVGPGSCTRASRGKSIKYHCPENMLIVPPGLVLAPDQPVGVHAACRLSTEKRPSGGLCQKPPHCLSTAKGPQWLAATGCPDWCHQYHLEGSCCDDVWLACLPSEETGLAPGKPETPKTNKPTTTAGIAKAIKSLAFLLFCGFKPAKHRNASKECLIQG